MDENCITWRANHGDIGKIISLIDLLEHAREVLKQFPNTAFTIGTDLDNKTITLAIVGEHKTQELTVIRYTPNVKVPDSITLHCS